MKVLDASKVHPFSQKVLYVLFTLTFMVLPFYYQDNFGGEGMSLPFNATIWIGVVLIVGTGLLNVLLTKVWIKPRYIGLLLVLPFGIILSGLIAGVDRPSEWLIRVSVIVGGFLFWFALLQFRTSRRDFENLLYLLLASMLLHCMVGLMQYSPEPFFRGWIPYSEQRRFLGMFQQPNLQASMLATGAALAVYLASVPGFSRQRWPMKCLVSLTLFLCVIEVVGSGSRTGLIGLLFALLMVFASRFHLWRTMQRRTALLLAVISLGAFVGYKTSGGQLVAYSKLEQLAESALSSNPESAVAAGDPRKHIYNIALNVFERSPIVGHGIGSFQREFQHQRAIYYDPRVGETIDNARFSHPHNEVLFWMIEGGFLAVAAIIAGAIAVVLQLKKLGWQRGGALGALLTPIVLHTQVELPFYISTLHWLILLVLLAMTFSFGAKTRLTSISQSGFGLAIGTTVTATALVSVFLAHSLLAQTGLMRFLKEKGVNPSHLTFALDNLYFRETGEYFAMRRLLALQLREKKTEAVPVFVAWAENYLSQIPDIQIFQDLTNAYRHLDDTGSAVLTIERAHAIYPEHRQITELRDRVLATDSADIAD